MELRVRMLTDGLLIGAAVRPKGAEFEVHEFIARRLQSEKHAVIVNHPVEDDEEEIGEIQSIETAVHMPAHRTATKRNSA